MIKACLVCTQACFRPSSKTCHHLTRVQSKEQDVYTGPIGSAQKHLTSLFSVFTSVRMLTAICAVNSSVATMPPDRMMNIFCNWSAVCRSVKGSVLSKLTAMHACTSWCHAVVLGSSKALLHQRQREDQNRTMLRFHGGAASAAVYAATQQWVPSTNCHPAVAHVLLNQRVCIAIDTWPVCSTPASHAWTTRLSAPTAVTEMHQIKSITCIRSITCISEPYAQPVCTPPSPSPCAPAIPFRFMGRVTKDAT